MKRSTRAYKRALTSVLQNTYEKSHKNALKSWKKKLPQQIFTRKTQMRS